MKKFTESFGKLIGATLRGFDRLLFRGTLLGLAYAAGMAQFLNIRRVLRKDYGQFLTDTTQKLLSASLREATEAKRPVIYLPSSGVDKEALARKIAVKDGVSEGPICVLKSVEPCTSYRIIPNRLTQRTEVRLIRTKCLHLYHYRMDPRFGFMHARVQTWFPFSIQIYVNGREWLAREMDRRGLKYERVGNCFVDLADPDATQRLADAQLRLNWTGELSRIAAQVHPALHSLLNPYRADYYWSVWQSEWATDVIFKNPADLEAIFRAMVLFGISSFSSGDIMRFLGQKVHGNYQGEIISDFKDRPEGTRLKHWVGKNSLKAYGKAGNKVLRAEATVNFPEGIKVYRRPQGKPEAKPTWRGLRRGVADLRRRAQVSDAATQRYLDALAAADTTTPLGDLLRPICNRKQFKKGWVRAVRPWADDKDLLRAINRPDFLLAGFRNRDLRGILFREEDCTPIEARRRSARVTRWIRMLRGHGLIRKLSGSNRYRVTPHGVEILMPLLRAHDITAQQIAKIGA